MIEIFTNRIAIQLNLKNLCELSRIFKVNSLPYPKNTYDTVKNKMIKFNFTFSMPQTKNWLRLTIIYTLIYFPITAPTAKANESFIVGFYEQWGIYSPNTHINDLPLERLTHLIYQRANVNLDGRVIAGDIFADLQHKYTNDNMEVQAYAGNFGQLFKAKVRHPHLKTLISIGGYQIKNIPYIARDQKKLNAFTQSTIHYLKLYNFDGVDINWNPSLNAKGLEQHNSSTSYNNYITLLKSLRLAFDKELKHDGKHYLLSTMVYKDMLSDNVQAIVKASHYVDFINLDTSQIFIPTYKSLTNYISPLYSTMAYPPLSSVNQWVNMLLNAGTQADKIVITTSPTVYGWQGVKEPYKKAISPSPGTWDNEQIGNTGKYSRNTLFKKLNEDKYKQHWDKKAKMPWAYNSRDLNSHFLSYENKQSIKEKLKYIKKYTLKGIGIIALHSDSKDNLSLVKTIYHEQHPIYSSYITTQHLIKKYYSYIILIFTFFIFTLGTFFYIRKNKILEIETEEQEKRTFILLRNQSQILEWHLTQLFLYLTNKQNSLLKEGINSAEELHSYTSVMLANFTKLLSQTTLSNSQRAPQLEEVSLYQIIRYLQQTWPKSKPHPNWINKITDDLIVNIDLIYLTQAITSLFDIFNFSNLTFCQSDRPHQETSGLFLKIYFSVPKNVMCNPAYHWNIRKVFLKIKNSGATLKQKSDIIELLIPYKEIRAIASQNNSPPKIDISNKKNKSNIGKTSIQSAPNRLRALNHFSQSATQIQGLGQLMIKACEFFKIETDANLFISVYQGDSLITNLGQEITEPKNIYEHKVGEFRCVLATNKTLSEEDHLYLNTLINHVQLVRQTLKNMVSKPVLLSELYKITSDKNKICYIKSDKGYVAVYRQGEKDPYYLSLRMRTIKHYFDDSTLLQIHRSYLVNPDKVKYVKHIAKKKFELVIHSETPIPISRSYLPHIREYAPQWFEPVPSDND